MSEHRLDGTDSLVAAGAESAEVTGDARLLDTQAAVQQAANTVAHRYLEQRDALARALALVEEAADLLEASRASVAMGQVLDQALQYLWLRHRQVSREIARAEMRVQEESHG